MLEKVFDECLVVLGGIAQASAPGSLAPRLPGCPGACREICVILDAFWGTCLGDSLGKSGKVLDDFRPPLETIAAQQFWKIVQSPCGVLVILRRQSRPIIGGNVDSLFGGVLEKQFQGFCGVFVSSWRRYWAIVFGNPLGNRTRFFGDLGQALWTHFGDCLRKSCKVPRGP